MNHGSLFSGIGGFDLAAEWMGWTNVFHCEWEEFPRKVLNYHFPKSISYGDIKETDFTIHRGHIDILTGGFPCQPYSAAGKRLGKEDDRHLWPEMLRAIREIQPRWVVGENVHGIVNWNGGLVFEEVQADLENEGYEVQPFILPAASVNAPHRRDRVWFVAYNGCKYNFNTCTNRTMCNECEGGSNYEEWLDANTNSKRQPWSRDTRGIGEKRQRRNQRLGKFCDTKHQWQECTSKPIICGLDDGIPRELDSITFPKWRRESIKAYGNAIVPQVVYPIFKAIESYESKN
jgi:DNA (cytosine-5)-methyltransferase 1